MSNPILSIIIPSYNTSKYVDECIPTFIDERLFGKIIIYLIDDGATDNTKEKLQPYLDKYPDLFKFIHKENGGHGSVINYGVWKLIESKYFKVIDGDDWVLTDALVELVKFLENTSSDVILTDYTKVYKNTKVLIKGCNGDIFNSKPIDNLECTFCIHSITYKTSLFLKNGIKLTERVFYEDNEYKLLPLVYVNTVDYLPVNLYQYRLDNENQSVSIQSFIKHNSDRIKVMNSIANFYLLIRNEEHFCINYFMKTLSFLFEQEYIVSLYTENNNKNIRKLLIQIDKKKKIYPEIYKKMGKKYKLMKITRFRLIQLYKKLFRNKIC